MAATLVATVAFPLSGAATRALPLAAYVTLVILVVGACLAPGLVYGWRSPVPLGFMNDTLNKRVVFMFRDAKYAAEFAALNGTKTGAPV